MLLALTNARVFTATGEPALASGVVVVEDARIRSVDPWPTELPEGCVAVDLAGRTLLPGFVDAHVHLVYREGLDDWYTFELATPLEAAAVDATINAGRLLEMGITSVRDVGTRGNIAVVLRDAIRGGRLGGPRVRASKQIISVSGGLTDVHPSHLPIDGRHAATTGERVTGPWEARDAVRRQVKDGVDWIKVEASGTFNSPYSPGDRETMSAEELRAIVDEASDKGRPVACHAESRRSILRAAAAGVRTIEHAVDLDDAAVEAVLEAGAAICPTMGIYRNLAVRGREFGFADEVVERNLANHRRHVESIRRAHRAGLTIIAGSDAGSSRFPHDGALLREICLYVELVGMTAGEALVTATRAAATVIGLGDEVGTIEAGKRADLVVIAGDPLGRITTLTDPGAVEAVLQDGRVVAGALPGMG